MKKLSKLLSFVVLAALLSCGGETDEVVDFNDFEGSYSGQLELFSYSSGQTSDTNGQLELTVNGSLGKIKFLDPDGQLLASIDVSFVDESQFSTYIFVEKTDYATIDGIQYFYVGDESGSSNFDGVYTVNESSFILNLYVESETYPGQPIQKWKLTGSKQ